MRTACRCGWILNFEGGTDLSGEMKKEERIKVVYVETEKEAEVIEMENTLEEMQAKVGGLITPSYFLTNLLPSSAMMKAGF